MSSINVLRRAAKKHNNNKKTGNSQLKREVYQDHLNELADRAKAKKIRTKKNRKKKSESQTVQKKAAAKKLYDEQVLEANEFSNVSGSPLVDCAPPNSLPVGLLGPSSSPKIRRTRSTTANPHARFQVQLHGSGLFQNVLEATQAKMRNTALGRDLTTELDGKKPRKKRYFLGD